MLVKRLATIILVIIMSVCYIPVSQLGMDFSYAQPTDIVSEETQPSNDDSNTKATEENNTDQAQKADTEKSNKDTDKEHKTETQAAKAKEETISYSTGKIQYECDDYTVELAYGKDAKIPEGTKLKVSEIQADSKDKAEQKQYKEYFDKSLSKLQNEKGGDKIASLKFAKFYDITLMADGQEIEPEDEVSVTITYKKEAKEKLNKKDTRKVEDSIRVIHLSESERTGEIQADPIKKKDTEVTVEKNKLTEAAFSAESFSVYGIVYTVDFEYDTKQTGKTETVVEAKGKTFRMEAVYDTSSGIPADGVRLSAKELKDNDPDTITFDIKIASEADENVVYQPAEGHNVALTLVVLDDKADTEEDTASILHVCEDGTEEILNADLEATDEGYVYSFETESFSTFTLYMNGTNSGQKFTTTVKTSRFGGAATELSGTAKINNNNQVGWISFDEVIAKWNPAYSYTGSNGRYSVLKANDSGGTTYQALCAVGFFEGLVTYYSVGRIATSGDANGSLTNYDLQIELNDNSLPVQIIANGNTTNENFVPSDSAMNFTAESIAEELGYDMTGMVAYGSINNMSVDSVSREQITVNDVPTSTSTRWWTRLLAGETFNFGSGAYLTTSYPATNVSYPVAYKWIYNSGTVIGDTTYVINIEKKPICKIVDTDDGEEHPFETLNAAVAYARSNGNGSPMSASNPVKIEMLVDYMIPSSDKVALNKASDNIIITTAATSGGQYNFTPTFTSAEGRTADDSGETAILMRGWDGTGTGDTALFYLNNASAKLKTENITLDGAYDTANHTGRAVYVDSGDACFTGGTTVRNFHAAAPGGAVYVANGGNHTLIDNSSNGNVVFSNCGNEISTSNYDGAAICIQSGNLIINNSGTGTVLFEKITGNKNADGGAIGVNGSNSITLNNTSTGSICFVDCTACYGGALETDSGSITLNNSGTGTMEFLRCYTDYAYEGGAIYCGGKFSTVNNGTITFTGTIGTDAEAKTKTTKGGAIYIYSSASDACSITGSGKTSFTNCKANTDGGAIYCSGSVTIDQTGGTSFTNCTGNNGGGVYGNSTVSVTNCSFTNCTASTGTGGGIHSAKQLSVSGSVFTDCSAKKDGGAIYIAGPDKGAHIISGCTFDGHKNLNADTVNATNGGAIYINDGSPSISDSRFYDLTSTTNGGAVNMGGQTNETLTMEDCTFDGHDTLATTVKNASVGGAVYMNANNGITLKNLTVSDCWTSGNGGGVYSDDSITSISGTISIEDCYTTGGKGGGAYFNSTADLIGATAVTFKDCHADSTSASNGGGGAYFNGATTLDAAVSFEDCYTGGNGGAMYFANDGTMTGVNVDGHKTLNSATNNAVKGGAIFLANSKTLTINGGEIRNCSASDTKGGAINVGGSGAKVFFEGDAVVYDNKSTKDGESVQANVVLDQNTNTMLQTTSTGLTSDAHIGVYVTGTTTGSQTEPFKSHGDVLDDFGTYHNSNSGKANLHRFTNDRVNDSNGDPLHGEVDPKHNYLIRWAGENTVAPTNVNSNNLPFILILITGLMMAGVIYALRRRESFYS